MARTLYLVLLCSMLAYGFVKIGPLRIWIEEVDFQYLDGMIFEIVGKDQGSAKKNTLLYRTRAPQMDFHWLETFKETEEWVAHALGGKGQNANKKSAYRAAKEAGFLFFEVDIIFRSGELICAHDYDEEISADSCSFDWLIDRAKDENNVWFILDVKTDFKAAYDEINRRLKKTDVGKKFIPQIYKFNQLEFIDLTTMSAPLFTAYRRNMSLGYITSFAESIRLPGITIPPRPNENDFLSSELFIFTHGVNNLEHINKLKANGVSGFYIKTHTLLKLSE